MAYDPDSRLPVLSATVRAAGDTANLNWVARVADAGITAVRSPARGGRIRWIVWSETARLTIDQWMERAGELTLLDPSIAQLNLVRALKAAGFLAQSNDRTTSGRREAVCRPAHAGAR